MSRGAMSAASAIHMNIFGPHPIVVFGSEEQKQRHLPRLARGERISAFALTEPGAGSDLTALKTTASSAGVRAAVLSGANLVAIGDGTSDHWEVLQFLRAEPVAPGVYDLTGRLRGQAGTDAVMPDIWPVGSRLVLLDGVPRQIGLPQAARGLERHYRYGPARRPVGDPSWRHEARAFAGIGLRPYAPAHLAARKCPKALARRLDHRPRESTR